MTDDHERSRLKKETAISGLVEKVYDLMAEDRDEEATEVWVEIAEHIWPLIDDVIAGLSLDKKPTEDKVDRSYDKPYDLNSVLADADVALAYGKKHEERLAFSRRFLDTFDVSKERYQDISARQAIAESLNGLERYEECDRFLKQWKEENPAEVYPDFVYLRCLCDRKDLEKARQLADKYMTVDEFDAPMEDVRMLYEMASLIYGELGEEELRQKAEEKMNE